MESYHPVDVHVPVQTHGKLMKAIRKSGPVSVKLDLGAEPRDKIYVTWGQRKKIEEAVAAGKKDMTLRFSGRQARCNIQSEGGFLGAMLTAATRFLPAILAGLVAGTARQEEGNGMFLGRRDRTYQIRSSGEGLVITPVPHSKIQGFYVKHDDDIYQGKGILHGLFGKIPLLNLLF